MKQNEVSSDFCFKFQGGDYGIRLDSAETKNNVCSGFFTLNASNIWVSVIFPDGSLLLGEGYR